jgi:hypothetical protein
MNRILATCAGDLDNIDEVGSSMTPSALRGALEITKTLREEHILARQELEVLLQVFVHEKVSWKGARLAILGAPIWVGTPIPVPQTFVPSADSGPDPKRVIRRMMLSFLEGERDLE